MIARVQQYFSNIPAVFIDGTLYAGIALFGACTAVLSQDEAAKFIVPMWLFVLRAVCSIISATLLAIKMYRSTAFAEHQEMKKQNGHTDFIRKQPENG